jgi:hypothetical protein
MNFFWRVNKRLTITRVQSIEKWRGDLLMGLVCRCRLNHRGHLTSVHSNHFFELFTSQRLSLIILFFNLIIRNFIIINWHHSAI